MTYLDLLRDADRQLDDGRITIGEYEQMIKPLECEVQPEIVRCGECEHSRVFGCELYCTKWVRYTSHKGYCHRGAERRTE